MERKEKQKKEGKQKKEYKIAKQEGLQESTGKLSSFSAAYWSFVSCCRGNYTREEKKKQRVARCDPHDTRLELDADLRDIV